MRAPGLTVIMTNYNDGKYIPGAVQGVLDQSYPVDRILIVDDGSTDDSLEILAGLAAAHPVISVLENERNLGVVKSFNKALEATGTEYVCFVSMDDAIDPHWLQKSMTMLLAHPAAGICCTDLFELMEEEGHVVNESRRPWSDHPRYFPPREFAHIAQAHWIAGTTVVVKTDALLEAGGYREDLRWHSDVFAWLVVALRYGACYIPECLVTLRVRSSSHSMIGMKDWNQQREVLTNYFRAVTSKEFLDVLPGFIWGNLMVQFGENAVRVVLEDPTLWSTTHFLLIQGIINK